DYALELVEELKEEFDVSTIAFKLASILSSSTYVQGNNHIGKSESDIEKLIEYASKGSDRDGGDRRRNNSRGRSRNGGGNSRFRDGDRNRENRDRNRSDRGDRSGDRRRTSSSSKPRSENSSNRARKKD
ncbi:DEAD/DEAH box helicase, partial [Aliarcobacter butzleri]|nr:DEAD/DEAH box helicase [Aliarcobacter butzleri]